jgi:hypothetical protein
MCSRQDACPRGRSTAHDVRRYTRKRVKGHHLHSWKRSSSDCGLVLARTRTGMPTNPYSIQSNRTGTRSSIVMCRRSSPEQWLARKCVPLQMSTHPRCAPVLPARVRRATSERPDSAAAVVVRGRRDLVANANAGTEPKCLRLR